MEEYYTKVVLVYYSSHANFCLENLAHGTWARIFIGQDAFEAYTTKKTVWVSFRLFNRMGTLEILPIHHVKAAIRFGLWNSFNYYGMARGITNVAYI